MDGLTAGERAELTAQRDQLVAELNRLEGDMEVGRSEDRDVSAVKEGWFRLLGQLLTVCDALGDWGTP